MYICTRMERLVRYFCMVGPPAPKGHKGLWWPDLGFRYANALLFSAGPMRIVPVGNARFDADGGANFQRWREMAPLFSGALAENFVNVVCAPMGAPMTPALSLPSKMNGTIEIPAVPVLAGLWTAGQRNIAITSSYEAMGDPATDLEALYKYDLVIVQDEPDAIGLRDRGVTAQHYTPHMLTAEARFVSTIMGPRR